MKYLLRIENQAELSARKKYLEQTFNLWFIEKGTIGAFIVLESIPPSTEKDTCIIYGHNSEVLSLFKNNMEDIIEKNIYIISCQLTNPKDFLVRSKRIFLTPQYEDGMVRLRIGRAFGFDFDITDVELNLYNSHIKNIPEKLSTTFKQIETFL